ncbi:MAG: hypothetical protein QXE31_02385 [Candidatus Woesearchaeota archaeon]
MLETFFTKFLELMQKDFSSNLFNLLIYVFGMVIYVVVIWHFYRNLSKRELFRIFTKDYLTGFSLIIEKIKEFFDFVLHYIIIFPVITFIWFLILSAFLLFLSKSNDVSQILIMSITIISTSRIMAYYNETLADEVAKLVPYGLLGVFIVDPTYFSLELTIEKFLSLPNYLHLVVQYLLILIILEVVLKIVYSLFTYKKIKNK